MPLALMQWDKGRFALRPGAVGRGEAKRAGKSEDALLQRKEEGKEWRKGKKTIWESLRDVKESQW